MVTRKPNLKVIAGNAQQRLEDDIDALFKLPLAEFISARKNLEKRLKKEARSAEADRVKMLAKPSISAWTVNQLYWRHRETFDRLLTAGQRFREAQVSSKAGKVNDMRDALDSRREALAQLSDFATDVLVHAGHNAGLDTIRRVATTLEAMSAYASLPDGFALGRFSADVDPPGFDSLASFVPTTAARAASASRVTNVAAKTPAKTPPKSKTISDGGQLKQARQGKLAEARTSLHEAKRSLIEAKATSQRLKAAEKKAASEATEADKRKRESERRYKEASTASAEAAVRAQNAAREAERATKALEEAIRAVKNATDELESVLRG